MQVFLSLAKKFTDFLNMAVLTLLAIISVVCTFQYVFSFEVSRDDFNKLEQRMDALEHENRELKRLVLPNGMPRDSRFVLDSMEGPVAFTAAIKPSFIDHVDPGQIIRFETTITDIGGGYNNATGIFIAPRPGIYAFSCALLDHYQNGLMLHAEIVKDNHTILGRVFAHAEQDKYRDQGAQTVVTHLKAGEQVWVRIWDSQDLSLGGQLYSTFTGFLLYAD